jgi:hypothetical protein
MSANVHVSVSVKQTTFDVVPLHQWRNDLFSGIGKRVSKDGTLYLGNWKKGLKHGDGIARVVHYSILDPIGMSCACACA